MATPTPTSPSEPVRVVVDTREQLPYQFDPAHVTTVRRALPAGDYSLEGYESAMAIERKSLEDFVASAISHRERFGRELRLLAEYDFACIVVEGSLKKGLFSATLTTRFEVIFPRLEGQSVATRSRAAAPVASWP